MPAEKLTKRRFFQILIMLGILVFVFLYRTYQYSESPNRKSHHSEPAERTKSAGDFEPVFEKQQ